MNVTPVANSTTTCTRCGKFITLVPFGLHYKYVEVTRLKQRIWKCLPTAEFPVRSHEPSALP
jgi:hypothetical protein